MKKYYKDFLPVLEVGSTMLITISILWCLVSIYNTSSSQATIAQHRIYLQVDKWNTSYCDLSEDLLEHPSLPVDAFSRNESAVNFIFNLKPGDIKKQEFTDRVNQITRYLIANRTPELKPSETEEIIDLHFTLRQEGKGGVKTLTYVIKYDTIRGYDATNCLETDFYNLAQKK